jgi:predicted amidohydrolase
MTGMRIAAVQHDIVWEDRDANFGRLAPQVARAVGAGAELVLLTETFSTGFSMTPGIGEPEGGPSAQFLARQAAEHGVWVGGTCPETAADGELPYNSFVLAGPDGTVHRYRKLHPFTHAGEHERFRAGDEPVTVEIGGLRVTPFICYDLRFADVFWRAALDTDVYLVPANWPSPRRLHWQTLLQARAIENQAYVVGCNRVGTAGDGTEHAGDSRIVSPMGELLATAAGVETIVLADVDASEVAATRDRLRFLPDRREQHHLRPQHDGQSGDEPDDDAEREPHQGRGSDPGAAGRRGLPDRALHGPE